MRMRGGLLTGSLRQPCMLPPRALTTKKTGVSHFEIDFGTRSKPSAQASLTFVTVLRSLDTRDVPPMAHALDLVQRLRVDLVTAEDGHLLFQSVAPQVEGDLYLVPKVIE